MLKNDEHWKAFYAAVRQREVPSRQALVRYLSATLRIPSAMPRIDDLLSEILVALVAHRRDDREFAPSLSLPEIPAIVGMCTPAYDSSPRDSKGLPSGYPRMWPKIRLDTGSTFLIVTRY